MKAAIDITIPAGTGDVKIELSSDTHPFIQDSHPKINNDAIVPTYGGKTLTWNIPQTDKDQLLSLSTAIDEREEHDWGKITIKITGQVSKFISDNGPLTDQIVGIEFVNNGELAALKLGENQRRFNYFPNLTVLNVSGNKLSYIPLKEDTDDEGKKISISTSYIIGKQTPDVTFEGMSGNAKDGIKLTAEALNFGNNDNPLQGATDFQIATLYQDGKAVNYAVADPNYASTKMYTFKDGAIYVDGNFTADIQVNDAKYAGAIICGVPVTVEAATFEVLKAEGDAHGTVNIGTIEVGDKLKKGQTITVTPEPKDGYKLNGEPKTKGLTKTRNDNDVYYYTVTGDDDIEITASFAAEGTTLKYTAPANATITVKRANGTEVNNGASVTVGEKLTIIVKPNNGYTVSIVKNGDTNITENNISKDPGIFKAEVTVGADGVNITAEVKAAESSLTIVYRGGDGLWEGADLINATTGEKVGEPTVSGSTITYSKVQFGTPLDIVLKLKADANAVIESVTINSQAKNFREKADEPGKFIIEDYYMLETDVRVVVKVVSLSDITITPTMEQDKDDNKYYVIYDGMPNPVTYTVSPNNMQGVKVQYARDEQDAQPQDNAYTDCGNYVAYFSYDADKTHQIASGSEKVTYKIVPAQVVITEVPTVTIGEDNKYVIKGGKAAYMRDGQPIDITDVGKFVLADGYTTYNEGEKDVKVNFVPNDTKNLKQANATVILELEGVKKYTVKVDPSSKDILTMWNGNAQVKNGVTVLEGVAIRFEIEKEEGLEDSDYDVYQIDGNGNIVSKDFYNTYNDNGVVIGTDTRADGDANTIIFRADITKERPAITLGATCDTEEERKQTVTYNGSVQAYDPLKLVLLDPTTKNPIPNGDEQAWTWTITYILNGQTVAEPTNAGTYTVTLERAATGHYQAFSTTATLVIDRAELTQNMVPTPTASRVNVGQPLYYSSLTGSADIAGYYDWGVDSSQDVTESNKTFSVVFYPSNDNYKPLTLENTVTVPVTDEAIIVFWGDNNGYLTVKDAGGKEYHTGDVVEEGTVLTFTATPYDNTKFEFESLIIDGVSYSNGATYTFGKGSIEAYCSFKPKTTEIIVPDGQYAVELPDAVRGAKITYSGEPIVERGNSFTFTVTTLAADVSKLRVTANGETLTRAANGSYTISNITKKQEVQITLSNPTEVKVNIPLIYHEKGQPTSGRVQIINNTSNDGKYYYNDELTLIAYPETGVEFDSWSDKNKDSVRDIVLDKAEISLQAVFKGTPVTGIEDIESAAITTGKGFIMVKNVANAKVTVVSISGRLQAQEEVSGDTRIDVPQGIYVVVLESGSDVKRVKVIVK